MKVTSECSIDFSVELLKSILDQVTEKVFVLPVKTCYWNEGRHPGTVAKHEPSPTFFFFKWFLSVAGFQVLCQNKTISPWFNGRQQSVLWFLKDSYEGHPQWLKPGCCYSEYERILTLSLLFIPYLYSLGCGIVYYLTSVTHDKTARYRDKYDLVIYPNNWNSSLALNLPEDPFPQQMWEDRWNVESDTKNCVTLVVCPVGHFLRLWGPPSVSSHQCQLCWLRRQ